MPAGLEKIRDSIYKDLHLIVVIVVTTATCTYGFVSLMDKNTREISDNVVKLQENIALIQKDIYLIENNHLAHVQKSLENQDVINKETQNRLLLLDIKIEKVLTKLNIGN
jgi:hypothetical protein